MQSRLFSEQSDLIYNPHGEETELVEHFQGVVCAMQENLIKDATGKSDSDSDKQYVRSFKAQHAVYSYKTGQMEAEKVKVAHYLIPGLKWTASLDPFHPLLEGEAQKLQLSLFKEPNLKAQGFQAILHEWGSEW